MKKLIKSLYSIIPFKKEIFTVMKQVYTPSQNIYKHLHFKGQIKIFVDKERSFKMNHYGFELENELFWAGLQNGWEKVSIAIWVQLCQKLDNHIIFDLGANTGVYALIAKSINPKAEVHAFEPIKRVYEKLLENNKLNQYDIHCHELAVSNYNGEAKVFETLGEHLYSVTVNKNMHHANTAVRETTIKTIRLDTYIEQNSITNIHLLKIDVETHEPEVLEGMGAYLTAFKPVMLIEILTDAVANQVTALVAGLDYLYFNIDENGGVRLVKEITVSDYYNFLLCNRDVALSLNLLPK